MRKIAKIMVVGMALSTVVAVKANALEAQKIKNQEGNKTSISMQVKSASSTIDPHGEE